MLIKPTSFIYAAYLDHLQYNDTVPTFCIYDKVI